MDRETWHAAVYGVKRVGHDLATDQQQQSSRVYRHCPFPESLLNKDNYAQQKVPLALTSNFINNSFNSILKN